MPARGQRVSAAGGTAAPGTGGNPASMKKGAVSGNCSQWPMAAMSREYQRCSAGALVRRKPPSGSLMRSRPWTVAVVEVGGMEAGIGFASHWARCSCGTKPRFTSTCAPSSSCKGVITQKPEPSSVRAWVSTVFSGSHRPCAVTGRYSWLAALTWGHSGREGRGTGAACTR